MNTGTPESIILGRSKIVPDCLKCGRKMMARGHPSVFLILR